MRKIEAQNHWKPPYPTHDFSGQVIAVTGANIGLGLEAARHFVRLNAAKVILGVRSMSKGEVAKADIEASTGRKGVVDVYQLDLSSYASVKHFASQISSLPRIDAVVENAAVGWINILDCYTKLTLEKIAVEKFEMFEDDEATITVNVVSTLLLAVLLLPALRQSAKKFGINPTLATVSSGVHLSIHFPEGKANNIFATLNDEKTAKMSDRYVSISRQRVLASH